MSILRKNRIAVKPTRRTPRPASRFGAGILATHPVVCVPFSMSDEAWAVGVFNDPLSAAEYEAREDAYNEMLDQRELEAAQLDRYTRMNLPL